MLSYKKWKTLNESFAGAFNLGVAQPTNLGLSSPNGFGLELEEAKKRAAKKMFGDETGDGEMVDAASEKDEPDVDVEGGDGEFSGGCKGCSKNSKKKMKKMKKAKKMFGDMDDSMGGPPAGLPPKKKKKPHPHAALGDDAGMGGDDMGMGGDDMGDDMGGEDMPHPDEEIGDDDMGMGGDDMGDDDDMGDMGGDDDMGDMGMGGDDDMGGDDMGGDGDMPPPHKKKKKPAPPMGGGDMGGMGGPSAPMFSKKLSKKKMKKEAYLDNDAEFFASVKSMMAPTDQKFDDGFTKYYEDSLLPETDPNAQVKQPGPGDVGFAPQGRVGW